MTIYRLTEPYRNSLQLNFGLQTMTISKISVTLRGTALIRLLLTFSFTDAVAG